MLPAMEPSRPRIRPAPLSSPRTDVELRQLIPSAPTHAWRPEHACALMETELGALSSDIAAARDQARRAAAAGLDFQHDPVRVVTGERVALAGGEQS